MKIAVLGINGFLGKQLFTFFEKQGHVVIGWGRKKPAFLPDVQFQTLTIDADVYEGLIDCHLIVNCVGAGVQSNSNAPVDELYQVNLYFPIRLICYLQKAGFLGRLVTFGTYFEIGNDPLAHAYSEDEIVTATHPVSNHYCASKRLLTRFLQSWKTGFDHVHLFLPTVYGPGEAHHRLLPYLVACAKEKRLPQLSQGTQLRQYLHINNLCEMVQAVVDANMQGKLFLNLPSELTCTIKQLASRVYTYFGSSLPENSFGNQAARDIDMPHLMLSDLRYKNLNLPTPVDYLEDALSHY